MTGIRQQLTGGLEQLRSERQQAERRLQQQTEEMVARVRDDLRAESTELAGRLHAEIQARTQQDQVRCRGWRKRGGGKEEYGARVEEAGRSGWVRSGTGWDV